MNCSSSSSNFISNKYMKTSIYNTIALMITAMFTCTLLGGYQKKPRLIELAAQLQAPESADCQEHGQK